MRKRDQEEFERVFRSAYRSVLLTASLVLQDRGRAEEVTQDAFLRLYERWGGAVVFEHPAAWVRRVAVRDAIRRSKRERVRRTWRSRRSPRRAWRRTCFGPGCWSALSFRQ